MRWDFKIRIEMYYITHNLLTLMLTMISGSMRYAIYFHCVPSLFCFSEKHGIINVTSDRDANQNNTKDDCLRYHINSESKVTLKAFTCDHPLKIKHIICQKIGRFVILRRLDFCFYGARSSLKIKMPQMFLIIHPFLLCQNF